MYNWVGHWRQQAEGWGWHGALLVIETRLLRVMELVVHGGLSHFVRVLVVKHIDSLALLHNLFNFLIL
jgi:hypothetical protein